MVKERTSFYIYYFTALHCTGCMDDYDGFMLIKRDLYGSVEKATQLDARISRLKKTGAGKKGSTRTWSVVFLQFSVTFQWSESRRESGRGMFLFIVVIQ